MHLSSVNGATIRRPETARVIAMPQDSPDKEFRQGPRLSILLVEDDALVRRHVSRMLASLGHEVHSVADGNEALKILSETKSVDLLFTDIVMPGGIDGIALAEAARTLNPHLPVLLTSGYAAMEVLNSRSEIRGAQLLGKPYRLFQLREKLEHLFGYSGSLPAAGG